MFAPRFAAPAFAASFVFGSLAYASVTPAQVKQALAQASQSGKPLLVIAGAPER